MKLEIHGSGGGEIIADRPGRLVRLLVGHELLTMTANRMDAGEAGPPLHVHHEHTDGFYVTEGALTLLVGPEEHPVRATPGTLVLVPPGVVHTFRVDEPGAWLNLHAPDAGFAAYLRGEADGFDQHEPPPGGGRPGSEALVRGPGEGEPMGLGVLAVDERTIAPGFAGPPAHRHGAALDAFVVLDGVLTVRGADGDTELEAGGVTYVPPGAVPSLANPGDAPVRVLHLRAPAGFEPAP